MEGTLPAPPQEAGCSEATLLGRSFWEVQGEQVPFTGPIPQPPLVGLWSGTVL